ncbi:hypothetical protein D049_1134A, partial [Vibrio parahaemolyticus VPTS-2010]
MIESG